MVWNINDPEGLESAKIAHLLPQYCIGKGLDLGCGSTKAWPAMIGVDNTITFGHRGGADIVDDITKLELFADNSLGYIFSSHALEDIPDTKGTLAIWWGKLKVGGALMLYLPHKAHYPNVGTEGANPRHVHDFLPEDITKLMSEIVAGSDAGWVQIEDETRIETTEYSFFQVYRKISRPVCERRIFERHPAGKKRALIIRYGAIGDQIMAASILPGLREKGYHITYSCTPKAAVVLKHDPHIDEFQLQETDFVPNGQLGPFWEQLSERYDFVVNLCESVEGTLLALPGRLNHSWPPGVKQRLMNRNYLEYTHDLADVPYDFSNARFHASEAERAQMRKLRAALKGPVVYWSPAGSSLHKIYPFTQVVMAWLVEKTDAHLVLTTDPGEGKMLQDALVAKLVNDGVDVSRIHAMGGQWNIRQSLAFLEFVEVVVGPETGLLNAAGMMERVHKVVMMSHSSRENLTKHWKNYSALQPVKTPCWPCHAMHYNWDHCHQVDETMAALCASNISPERVFEAIVARIGMKKAA